MTSFHFLVVDDSVSDGVASPVNICLIGKFVTLSLKEGNGNLGDVFNRDKIGVFVLTKWNKLVISVGPFLESILFHILCVMKNALS